MSECLVAAEPASPAPPPVSPARPLGDRRAARLAKFRREQLVVGYLNRGVSVAEIAAHIGVGEKRMRAVIRSEDPLRTACRTRPRSSWPFRSAGSTRRC